MTDVVSEAIQLHPNDNVATVRKVHTESAGACEVVLGTQKRVVELSASVQFGHKIALADLAEGDRIIKYDQTIGLATQDIATGDHVHTHNVTGARDTGQGEGLATKGREKSHER